MIFRSVTLKLVPLLFVLSMTQAGAQANSITLRFEASPINAGGVVASTSGGYTTAYYPAVAATSLNFLDGISAFSTSAVSGTPASRINFRISADLPVPSAGNAWVILVRPLVSTVGSLPSAVAQAPIESISSARASFPNLRPGGETGFSDRSYAFQILDAGVGQVGVTYDIGFYPTEICYEATSSQSGRTGSGTVPLATMAGCSSAGALVTTSPMTFTIGVAQIAVTTPANTGVAGSNVTMAMIQAATLSASSIYSVKYATAEITDFSALTGTNCTSSILSSVYLPRNEAIQVDGSVFPDQTVSSTTQAPLQSLIVVAKLGAEPVTTSSYASNAVHGAVPWRTSARVGGFQNSTLNTSNDYQVRFMVRDAAGYVSPIRAGAASACATADCCLTGVKTADIETFLKTNKCFIATAVYRDENAAPVKLLRKFRNQVLLKNQWGQEFTRFYYKYSPAAAEWLEHHPYVRFGVKLVLTPIVGVAWLLTPADAGAAESTSVSPYLDQLKRTMPKSDGDESTESYTEQIRRKANPDPYGSESYSERLKRTAPLDDEDPDQGNSDGSYTEKLRARFKSDEDDSRSAIQSVLDGKSQLRQKRRGSPTSAAGVRIGTGMEHGVKLKDGRSDFQSVYGTGMHPDVRFFYEYQFLKDRYLGTLGVGVGGGLTYFNKVAKYSTTLTNPVTGTIFPTESDVKLSFYAMPTNAFLTYRFHPSKYLVPYAYGGPSTMFYYERRSDGRDGKRGFGMGTAWGVGAALQLNWMFPSATWDLYSSSGVHLLYLTAEYSQVKSSNTDVTFDFTGYSAGLTYEF